jgi:hypothetical protein
MACPTTVTAWPAWGSSISPYGTLPVPIIGATGSPVSTGASIVFCRLVAHAAAVDVNTALCVMDSTYTEYYSTVWCQIAGFNSESLAFCPIQGNNIHLKNLGNTNSITGYVFVLGYS